ncbi:unnamed protein product [Prunus armeniaca]
MPTLWLGLQQLSDRAIVGNPTVRLRPNSRDMCPRHIGTFRDSRICDRRSWASRARLIKFRCLTPSIDHESSDVVLSLKKC